MEKSVKELLNKVYTVAEARALNPLTLAYIGDGVFSGFIRKYLVAQGIHNVNHLTKKSVDYVKADAQSEMIRLLADSLTEEEAAIVRRGRNTHSHAPKNARVIDYRLATGLEALVGFLSLTGQEERLEALIVSGICSLEAQKNA
ncbi:MAG: ribonuclease III domain-containing protein [Eubacterium sp.]|nr:ribonuclease III domain-containing protein [Eubacterium sp.]